MRSDRLITLRGSRALVPLAGLTALVTLLGGCPRPAGPVTPRLSLGPGLPPLPAFPAVAPSSEERLTDALQVYEALPPGAAPRAALREQLVRHLAAQIDAGLREGQGQAGFKAFGQLVGLFRDALPGGPERLAAAALAPLEKAARQVLATYARRGGAEESLMALAVLETLDARGRERWRSEIERVLGWLTDLEEPLLGGLPAFTSPSRNLSKVFSRWPSAFLRQRLSTLLARQYAVLRPLPSLPRLPEARPYRMALAAVQEYPWQRVRLLLLEEDRPRLARFVESQVAQADADQRLLELVRPVLAPKAGSTPLIALAEAYAPKWPGFARALCLRAARAAPADPNGHFCLGELAQRAGQTVLALQHFGDALRARPDHREAWERLAAVYLERLVALLGQERLEQVMTEVPILEQIHLAAGRRWPGSPLKTSLADVYFVLGRGLFNEGRIAEAMLTLQKALRLKPTPQIQMQLGEIHFWRGQFRQAVQRFEAVYQPLKPGTAWRAYWELRLAPLVARSHQRLSARLARDARLASDLPTRIKLEREAKTELATAELVRSRALQLGKLLLQNFRSASLRAEVLYHVGWLFWQAGQPRIAVQSFNAALDEAPERSSTYVDVISFLVMRGYFEDALDAYHRALARSEISEYLKAYCTFWILDLGQRLKVDPERLGLAEVYLRHLKGDQWFHHLARFLRGEASYDALAREASTKGQRAELDFYHSMVLLRQGKAAEARALWQRIVDSEMMAFFEYKMVRRYLAGGAPDKPLKP